MRNVKKWLALGLATIMTFGAVACGNSDAPVVKESESNNGSENVVESETQKEVQKEPVLLEWYFRGNGQQQDTELVEARVNELLKEYPGLEHVSININCFPSADYATKVVLAQTEGAQIDILNTVSLDYATHLIDGSWMPIEDYISDELKAELPEWLWELGSYDGHIYMVPNYQNAFNSGYMLFPKEYMDKYGDYDAMYEVLSNPDKSITEKMAVLEEYVLAVRAGEGNTKYAGAVGQIDKGQLGFYFKTPYDHLANYFIVENDGQHKVEYLFASDEMKEIWSVYAEWYKKGIYAPDGVTTSNPDYGFQHMMENVANVYTGCGGVGAAEYVANNYSLSWGFDTVAIPIQEYDYVQNSWGAGGNGVSSTCENPEEAVLFIEALTTGTELGKEIYNTMVYGIEGKHYTKDANDPNRIETIEYVTGQGGSDTSYAGLKWIIGNSFYAYKNQSVSDGQYENYKKYNEAPETQSSSHNGFIVSSDNVTGEIEAINKVKSTYIAALQTGVQGDNFEAYYEEYIKALNDAGMQKVIDEYQKQLDAWLAANK